MEILIKVAQFVLSLSILIVLHELGHFIPAKLFKTRVEKFYLFFDPWFSLFKYKKGDTEYGIGWLPLGGYVKIAGMIDESMDKEQMKLPPQPWEFRSKPAWQRLIIMVGGVTVNVILGVFILWMMLAILGSSYLPLENLKYGVAVTDSSLYKAGFKDGDKIIGIVGAETKSLDEVNRELVLDNGGTVIIERDGQRQNIVLTEGFTQTLLAKDIKSYFDVALPAVIDSIYGPSLLKTGAKKGDKVIAVNKVPVNYYSNVVMQLQGNKNKEVELSLLRGTDTLNYKVKVDEKGAIGFRILTNKDDFKFQRQTYTFFGALPAAMHKGGEILTNYARQFKILFTKEGAQQIGGFASIANQYGATWDWERFWSFTAVLSFILAFMNILPIPALDGGHVMFLLYEVITRRKPSEKAMEYAQYVGLVIVLSLLLFANGNDIYKAIFK